MSWYDRLFQPVSNTVTQPETFYSVPNAEGMPPTIAPPGRYNDSLTVESALSLSSVFRSVQIISNTCQDLPLEVFRNGELIDSSLARQPDSNRSYGDFIKRSVISLALHGNAYFLQTKDARKQVVNVTVLDPNLVSIRFDDNGKKFYDVTVNNGVKTYTDDNIYHLRLLEIPGFVYGFGPIQTCRVELLNAKQTRDFAANYWYAGNGVPLGTLNTDQELDGDQVEAYLDGWYEMLRQNKTAVLSKGLKYEPLAMSPEDAQWLQAQQFNKTQIASLFGIPAPYILASIEGNSGFTYSNLSQIDQVYYRTTIAGYLKAIEDAFSTMLPNRVQAKFNLSNLLRADEKTRFENYEIAIRSGLMTVDEARSKEGLPPLPQRSDETPEADKARNIVEMIQKVYLGVGKVIDPTEARDLLNRAGADLGPLPDELLPVPEPVAPPNDAETDQPEPPTEPVS